MARLTALPVHNPWALIDRPYWAKSRAEAQPSIACRVALDVLAEQQAPRLRLLDRIAKAASTYARAIRRREPRKTLFNCFHDLIAAQLEHEDFTAPKMSQKVDD